MDCRFFVFGLGFSGQVVARTFSALGWPVAGTTRSGGAPGIEPVQVHPFSRQHPLPAMALEGVTHILSSIPPDEAGDPVLDMLGDTLCHLHPRWVGYLSTTGVYGDHQGEWVDENTPCAPGLARSSRRLAAERQWLDSGLPAHVFRLAGIYGPGRSAVDNVRQGQARRIVKPGQVFSRIHVEDIAATIVASVNRPRPGAVYNVCDDDPAPPQEVIAHACTLLGVVPPPEIPWEEAEATLSPMARSFYADNKRVRNDLIKQELSVRLRYPTYREGLAALRT